MARINLQTFEGKFLEIIAAAYEVGRDNANISLAEDVDFVWDMDTILDKICEMLGVDDDNNRS